MRRFGLVLCVTGVLFSCTKEPRPVAVSEPAETTPKTVAVPSSQSLPEWSEVHQFFGAYMKGQKVGWAEERIQLEPGGTVRATTTVSLQINRGGVVMALDWREEARFEAVPGGRTIWARSEQSVGGQSKVIHEGKREGDAYRIRTTVDGNVQDSVVPLPMGTVEDRIPSLHIRRLLAARPGQPVITYDFDFEQLKDLKMESSVVSRSKTRLHGVPVTVLEVRSVIPADNLTMTERVTEAGQVLDMQVGPLFRLLLEDKAIAKDVSAATPDMFVSASIGLDTPLGDTPLRSLMLRVGGVPEGAIAADARQSWKGDRLTLLRRTHAQTPTTNLSDADRQENRAVTPRIDHGAVAIQDLAAKSRAITPPLARVLAINKTVHGALRYTLETAPESASAILRGGGGDCTEYSRLTVAVLRAAGFPAREVTGVAYVGDANPGLGYHAWVEVYVDGRWFPMDPTWNQVPLDASHITLGYGKSTAFVGLVGGIKAKVLSVNGKALP